MVARLRSCLWAVVAVLGVTAVFAVTEGVNATTAGFAFLITIFLIAATWGLLESIVASITATACFNYFFLPPIGTWHIADSENWVALAAFLISSLIASQLSDRAKKRTGEARNRQIEMQQLYALSRSFMLMDSTRPIGGQIAPEVARTCGADGVAIYDRANDAVYCAGSEIRDVKQLKRLADESSAPGPSPASILWAPLRLGDRTIGSMVIQGGAMSKTALQALTSLVAISLESARNREIAVRAEAARNSEEFKSTLLDGLAHEFKTPLTSIKAAASALLASSVSDPAHQSELLTIVDQEAGRLSRLVTETTHLARIEAGKVQLAKRRSSVDSLVRRALDEMDSARDGRAFEVSISSALPEVAIDSELMCLALRQLVDNAIKYSPPQSPIRISADAVANRVGIHVHNWGDPIPESERDRIFEKFYRGPNARRQAGTGMGLSIAREILMAHGGTIQFESTQSTGTEFVMEFPSI